MGGTRKKLEQWAGFYFGFGVGRISGNCRSCTTDFGERKPVIEPPCHRCPKYLLYPKGPKKDAMTGVRPDNQFIVHLFHLAMEQRVAGMGGTMSMMCADTAIAVIELHSYHFNSEIAKTRALELMWVIARSATVTIQKREEQDRLAAEQAAENKNRGRIGRGTRRGW